MMIKKIELGRNPTFADIGNFLARVRRAARDVIREKNAALEMARALDHEAERLRQSFPESMRGVRVAAIASQHYNFERKANHLHVILKELGYALLMATPLIDACTTLAQRCELLNINVADRGLLTEKEGVARILLEYGLEDSATHRLPELQVGAMVEAVNCVFGKFTMMHEETPMLDEELCDYFLLFYENVSSSSKSMFESKCYTLH
jgi:hypothetical protein